MNAIVKREYLRGGAIILFLNVFAGAVNFGFQIVAGRTLPPNEYGRLTFVFTLLMMFAIPFSAITTGISRKVSIIAEDPRAALCGVRGSVVILTGYLVVATIVLPAIAVFSELHVGTVLLIFVLNVAGGCGCIYVGIATGLQMAIAMSFTNVLLAVSKFFGTIFSSSVDAILIYCMVGQIASILILCLTTRRTIYHETRVKHGKVSAKPERSLLKYIMSALVVNLLLIYMQNSDVLLVRFAYGEEQLGIYTPAMSLGRIILYVAMAISSALLSYSLKENAAKGDSFWLFKKTTLFTGALSVAFVIGAAILGPLIITFMYGEKYAESTAYIVSSALLSVSISLCYLIMNYLFAESRFKFFAISCTSGCVLGTVAAYLLRGNGINAVIYSLTTAFALVCAVNFIEVATHKRRTSNSAAVSEEIHDN
jgi:O-antigen/teichoic acid export membrane protein